MFIQFDFGNFRSFRDLHKFSLEASPLRANDNGLDENNVFLINELRLLKSKAIFGGNSSGKSNLVTAISAFCYMVSRSVAEEGVPSRIWRDRFQLTSDDWDEQPIFFQYVFLIKEKIYRYGFQLLQDKVHYEWLFSGMQEEVELFMRTPANGITVNQDFFPMSDPFIDQAVKGNTELYREDSLFLTAGALTGNSILTTIRNKIRNIITADGAYDGNAHNFALRKLEKGREEHKQTLIELLKAADTGVEGLEVFDFEEHQIDKNGPTEMHTNSADPKKQNTTSLFSVHSRYDENGKHIDKIVVPFRQWESQGTAKIFSLGSLVLDALADGRVIAVDEFDSRLHPNLTLKITDLFNNPATNPLNAQLIFVTHDASLLRRAKLRRDQICMVNKNRFGVSTLSSLIEFKGVRKDASYDKEYLNGNYSAVPYLDQMDWVVKKSHETDVKD